MPKREDPVEQLAELARIERLRTSGQARLIRLRAGISAYRLAKTLGVRPATVLSWEEGESKPRAAAALAWLRALDQLKAEIDKPQEEEPPLVVAAGGGYAGP